MEIAVWRTIQKNNFRDLKTLADFLHLDISCFSKEIRFPLNLPRRLAEKIEKGKLDDPLLKQFVPLPQEHKSFLDFVQDPLQETLFCKTSKLLQKYSGRALLLTTSACAMHCRFCFRQNFDYAEKSLFKEELEQIKSDTTLREIILSGGDPLSLSDDDLRLLIHNLEEIDHIKIIRFHSRFPIGIPERISSEFLKLLGQCSKQIVFVLHANHPKEFDEEIFSALKSIQKLGIPILLQSVLLQGINDEGAILKQLFENCIYYGIIPYYLHQLDKVRGAAHFEVPEEKGKKLLEELRKSLPGYALPLFVREIPKESSKTLL